MSTDWQDLAAAIVVLTSISYLGYRIWQLVARHKAVGCGSSCRSCDAKSAAESDSKKPFVSVDDLAPPLHRKRHEI